MEIRTRYDRNRHTKEVGETSRTKQAFKDECDINSMIKRHQATGLWDHIEKREPHYGDFSKATDLKTAMDIVLAAQDAFDALPSEVRGLCDNNPEILLRALASPEETAALFDAGLPMGEGYKPWRENEPDSEQLEAEAEEKIPPIEGGE